MSGEVTKSVVNGATWSGIAQIVSQGLRLLAGIILWRLLTPGDFGLVAMVAIVTAISGNLIDIGFIEALVQRKEITPKHTATIFWVVLLTGLTLCLLVVALSPVLADFFHTPQIAPLLAVSSVILFIQSSGAVHSALLRRRLLFFRASLSDFADAFGYIAGAITAAYLGMGVWSLIIGNITGCIPGVTLRWILSGWRPSFTFSIAALKDLWAFGINNVGTRIVNIAVDKIDFLILGKFLIPATLGFYSQSLKLVRMPSDILGSIGNRIGLPALAIVQNENERLKRGLLKGEAFLAMVGLPVFIGMIVVAPELVLVFLGPQWELSVLPLRILCVSGCIAILNICIPAVFMAKGRPDINLKLSLIQLAMLAPFLLIGVRYGAEGIASVISFVSVLAWLIRQKYVHQVIGLNFKEYLLSLYPSFTASLIMSAGMIVIHYVFKDILTIPDILLLTIELLCGAGIYLSILKIRKSPVLDETVILFLEMVKPYGKTFRLRFHTLAKKSPGTESFHN